MKFLSCLILVLINIKTTSAQLPVNADTVFNYIKTNSVYTSANWQAIQIKFKQK